MKTMDEKTLKALEQSIEHWYPIAERAFIVAGKYSPEFQSEAKRMLGFLETLRPQNGTRNTQHVA